MKLCWKIVLHTEYSLLPVPPECVRSVRVIGAKSPSESAVFAFDQINLESYNSISSPLQQGANSRADLTF